MYIYAKLFGGGNDIAFTGTLLAIFGAPIFTLILSKKGKGSIAEA